MAPALYTACSGANMAGPNLHHKNMHRREPFDSRNIHSSGKIHLLLHVCSIRPRSPHHEPISYINIPTLPSPRANSTWDTSPLILFTPQAGSPTRITDNGGFLGTRHVRPSPASRRPHSAPLSEPQRASAVASSAIRHGARAYCSRKPHGIMRHAAQ
jgi:hypothetical protein